MESSFYYENIKKIFFIERRMLLGKLFYPILLINDNLQSQWPWSICLPLPHFLLSPYFCYHLNSICQIIYRLHSRFELVTFIQNYRETNNKTDRGQVFKRWKLSIDFFALKMQHLHLPREICLTFPELSLMIWQVDHV